jgi:integrase/recombinase XerD
LSALEKDDERTRSADAKAIRDRASVPQSLRTTLSRFGIRDIVQRHARRAETVAPSLARKSISPHIIRHTTATHLLRSGVDINTIRAWLGHVSIETTNIYAEIDLEAKAKALAACEVGGSASTKPWHDDPTLMAFLKSL